MKIANFKILTFYKSLNNFISVILMIILLVITVSCDNNSNKEVEIDKQKELLLELHDTLMLELPQIKHIKKSLLLYMNDSIIEVDSLNLMQRVDQQLTEADTKMWDWMHQFDINYQAETDSLTLVYYDNQYEQLLKVKAGMNNAIQQGERVISSYGRAQ